MHAIGRIGVIIPDIYDSLEQELLQGIYSQARLLGYDVLVFCDICNVLQEYRNYPEIMGYENIYQLPLMADLDGILFCASRFLDSECRSMIYDRLEELSIPCLVIGEKTAHFPYIMPCQEESIYLLTKHLIEEHHCRKLYCLTGFRDDDNSMVRAQGFRRALEEAGIRPEKDPIFYGDFWKAKPRELGIAIAQGRIEKPDAIVCASDMMAASLCETLIENGISVPEDIAVTGYDGHWETFLSTPKITTICGRETQFGYMAVSRLYEMMTGKNCEADYPQQYLRYGTSCGCISTSDRNIENYITNIMNRRNDQKTFMSSNFSYPITRAASLEDLMITIYGFSYLLNPITQYAICLCEDWQFDYENTAIFREHGFSERMLRVLERNAEGNPELESVFMTKDLLPDLLKPHEPQLKAFVSLHHETQVFGYIAFSYPDAHKICLDDYLMNWCNAISNGLDALQKRCYQEYIRQQLEALSVIDPTTGLYNKRGLIERFLDLPVYSEQRDLNYMCILISYVQKNGIAVHYNSESELMIANALRLSSDTTELLCRLQDTVYAVILPISDQNIHLTAQERLIRLEEKIRYMQGGVTELQMPELVTDYSALQFEKISMAGSFFEEQLQSILQKAEAAAIMSGNYKNRLQRFRREMHASPQKAWSVSDISYTIGISASHFQRMYKTEFNVSFKEDLITARMEKAKKLLCSTELRVQEISDACGYKDYSHFMRQFKERIGVSALQYRKQNHT